MIISGLIISGIIIAMILKKQVSLPTQQPPQQISITPILDRIEQLERQQLKPILDRITQLEGLIHTPTLRGGPDSEGFGFPLPEEGHHSSSPASRNIIHHKDGSVTDADTLPTSISTFKNNEVRMVSRDRDGFIISTKTIRDAQKGNNASGT